MGGRVPVHAHAHVRTGICTHALTPAHVLPSPTHAKHRPARPTAQHPAGACEIVSHQAAVATSLIKHHACAAKSSSGADYNAHFPESFALHTCTQTRFIPAFHASLLSLTHRLYHTNDHLPTH
eukprot:3118590-Pleurochrysis_carterae.AAC.1